LATGTENRRAVTERWLVTRETQSGRWCKMYHFLTILSSLVCFLNYFAHLSHTNWQHMNWQSVMYVTRNSEHPMTRGQTERDRRREIGRSRKQQAQ